MAWDDAVWKPTAAMAGRLYQAITGFDPASGGEGPGTYPAEGQAYLNRMGLDLGQQVPDGIVPVALDHTRPELLRWAIEQFGGAGLQLALPLAWQDVIARGDTVLDVPAEGLDSDAGRPNGWGGHEVACGRYDAAGRLFLISWGAEYVLPPAAATAYCIGAEAAWSRSWISTMGRTPLDVDAVAALAEIEGEALAA